MLVLLEGQGICPAVDFEQWVRRDVDGLPAEDALDRLRTLALRMLRETAGNA